jgi:periplasmic protein TonB
MQSIFHALNIGTLATWLTVSGASTVACLVRVSDRLPALRQQELSLSNEGVIDLDQESAGSAPIDPSQSTEVIPDAPVEPLPVEAVAEIPPLAELTPVPEVPDLPAPKPEALEIEQPEPARQVPTAKSTTSPSPRQASRPASRSSARESNGAGGGSGAGTNQGAGAGAVGADRFAGGRRPKPNYPAECRSKGQVGRVGFTISIDEQGNVVGFSLKSPSPYPALNKATEDAVRRWKFKPGPRATTSASVTFQLND